MAFRWQVDDGQLTVFFVWILSPFLSSLKKPRQSWTPGGKCVLAIVFDLISAVCKFFFKILYTHFANSVVPDQLASDEAS